MPVDQRPEPVALPVASLHRLDVERQREMRSGMAHLIHDVGRIIPRAMSSDANVRRSESGVIPSGSGSALHFSSDSFASSTPVRARAA
jgi:hypothetical protein